MTQAIPDLFRVPEFSDMRERFITEFFIPHATAKLGEAAAQQLAAGLRSPNETAAVLLDVMVLFRQAELRNESHRAMQNFSDTVTDSQMVDLIVSRLNLKRQVITPANPNTFPPQDAVMESDESLLLRYALAPYGLSTTGTRTGYEFHALTVGERPLMSVHAESENVVVMRYEFTPTEGVARPKSARARMVVPQSGQVEVRILAFEGNGSASDSLVELVQRYLTRPDIAQESDTVTVKSAAIVNYNIDIDVKEVSAPNQLVNRLALQSALEEYVKREHQLGGTIRRSYLDHIAHQFNAHSLIINAPQSDVICEWNQAPYCSGITVHVQPREF
ncbi:hypothetical protein HC752_21890 [Vibrio sp. S9_S30]|uniref:baseplate J/gp47 family protein n=1 Tax=Vibrio sp. S9_S30 TaxID=2720226 RepID=UPI00167FED01|nr:baseplate J/gp47 family protein [Vibrio sp. S9_S30]MBD1559599.1 hypothetical protein [Vibrio sp. S9_S30]